MMTESASDAGNAGGCGSCISRRGLISAALAAGGSLAVVSPAAARGRWITVAAQGDIRVGKGKVVSDPADEFRKWIVTRPAIDAYRAFTATCTHAGCFVSGVVRERIVCNCHGSRFNIRTGEVVDGPAVRPLERFPVRLRNRRIQVFG